MAMTLRLDETMTASLATLALTRRCSTHSLIEDAIQEYLQRQGTQDRIDAAIGYVNTRYRAVLDELAGQ